MKIYLHILLEKHARTVNMNDSKREKEQKLNNKVSQNLISKLFNSMKIFK